MNPVVAAQTRKTISHDKEFGITRVKFDPKIDFPVDRNRCGKQVGNGSKLYPTVPALNEAGKAFLLEHMPKYFGVPGFYQSNSGSPKFVISHEAHKNDYGHFRGRFPPVGGLTVEFTSPDCFEVKPGGVIAVDSLTLRGHVHLPIIPLKGKEGFHNNPDIELPILTALLTGALIDFNRNPRVLMGFSWAQPISYMRVKKPTVFVMQKAIDAAVALKEFCRLNESSLQDVAVEVNAAYAVWCELRAIKKTHAALREACAISAARGIENAEVPPVDRVLEAVQAYIRKLLTKADSTVKELHAILQATPARELYRLGTSDTGFHDYLYPDGPKSEIQ